ncbi:tetratricopeptide repeat-containing sulfotransferase family protein [Cribrihabitans pelagius]|uniref:tetratricopeptide repeat-containing sulfotransferase family protein n=1 Tax=Cribrihabitans pelagius TaxID=1765746 RepID=UPI003B5A9E12
MNHQLRVQPSAAPASGGWLKAVQDLRAAGMQRQALGILVPMISRPDFELEAIDQAAICYFDLGDVVTALKLVRVMLQKWPGSAVAWAKLGAMEQALGDTEAAANGFKKALELDPFMIRALAPLNGLEPFSRNGQHTARLKKLSHRKDLRPQDRALVLNTLGQIEQRAGNSAAAMRYFRNSKAASDASHDPEHDAQLVDAQIAAFQPLPPGRPQPDGPKVIFVCGLPRSGTTLAEAVLQRHSAVGTIGESKALTKALQEVRKYTAEKGRGSDPWSWCGRLQEEEISIFRRYYFEVALQGKDKGGVIVDKMPMNCRDLALAHVLLPDARFVFMSRHPLDVGLSNFSICFQKVVPFTCRLDWLGSMIREVYRSALDYQAKLGSGIRVQSFRALVSDPERQIRDLLAHCGLEWEDVCLSPEEGRGAVNTASVLQVREKINTKGLDKWRAFEKELQPLTDALGGADWLRQWKAWDDHAAETGRFA